MPVQAIEVIQQQPTFWEGVQNELLPLIFANWYFFVIPLLILVIGFLIYKILKKLEEGKKSIFEKDYERAVLMAKSQYDRKRKTRHTTVTLIIGCLLAGFVSLFLIAFMGLMGFLTTLIVFPGIIGLAYGFDLLVSPFMKSDKVYIRFKENDKTTSRFVGNYLGSFYGNDGFYYLFLKSSVFSGFLKKEKFIVKIPQNYKFFVKFDDEKNDKNETVKTENADSVEFSKKFVNEIINFNDDSININFCKSFEKEEFFYYPVFHNFENNVLDFGLKYFQSDLRNGILGELYSLSQNFSDVSENQVKLNPYGQLKNFMGEDFIQKPKPKKRYEEA